MKILLLWLDFGENRLLQNGKSVFAVLSSGKKCLLQSDKIGFVAGKCRGNRLLQITQMEVSAVKRYLEMV